MQEQSTQSKYIRRSYHSRARHWQFPLMFMALICLVVSPIYAASFDCKKAATEMEKTICSDPKLSALDEDLAKVYGEIRSQLKGDAQALEQFTQSQREWLANLNQKKDGNIACAASKECLTISYQKRIKELQDKLSLALKKAPSASGEEKKYPPYPDVWGYELPWPNQGDVFVYKMPNGDFAITYPHKEKEAEATEYFIKYFFSGEQKILTKEEFRFIEQRKNDEKYNITLKNGEHMHFEFNAGGECTNYFTDIYFYKTDKAGRVVFKKMAFYLHDVPKKVTFLGLYELRKCAGAGEMLMCLENVSNGFVPLDDGTFLLTNGSGGFILRFDKDLNTKSELLNKKVYLIDRDVFVKNYLHKYKLDNSAKSYQSLHDELLKYFMSLKNDNFK